MINTPVLPQLGQHYWPILPGKGMKKEFDFSGLEDHIHFEPRQAELHAHASLGV